MEIVIYSLLKDTTKIRVANENYFFSLGKVIIQNGRYNGQEPTKLTINKTTATTSKTIPNVPEIFPNKYNAIIIAATIKRKNLSTPPIFFFIFSEFKLII